MILEEILRGEEKDTHRRHYEENSHNAKISVKPKRTRRTTHYQFNRMADTNAHLPEITLNISDLSFPIRRHRLDYTTEFSFLLPPRNPPYH